MMYAYLAVFDSDDSVVTANSPANLIRALDKYHGEGQWAPADYSFYKAVEGKYVPPSTPATIRFPEEK